MVVAGRSVGGSSPTCLLWPLHPLDGLQHGPDEEDRKVSGR